MKALGLYLCIGVLITVWHRWASIKLHLRSYTLRRTLISVLGWPIIMTIAIFKLIERREP